MHSCRNWLLLIPLSGFAGEVVVGIQEKQNARFFTSGSVSLIPGVPGGPLWSGVPKGDLVDVVYELRVSFTQFDFYFRGNDP